MYLLRSYVFFPFDKLHETQGLVPAPWTGKKGLRSDAEHSLRVSLLAGKIHSNGRKP